ncbi:MAG: hypothetical protein ACE5HN_02390 [Nitrospiria bacterium]
MEKERPTASDTCRYQCDIYHIGRRSDMTCRGITIQFSGKRTQPRRDDTDWVSVVTRWCRRFLKGAASRPLLREVKL